MTDHPSNREPVRPTVRPDLLRRKTNIVSAATTSTLFIATTKVAAFGRHHKRGAAAFGRGTSFVVSFVVAMNRVDVVAADTIFVCVSVSPDGLSVGRALDWMDGRSDGQSVLSLKRITSLDPITPKTEPRDYARKTRLEKSSPTN